MTIVYEVYVHGGLEPLNMQELAAENGAVDRARSAEGPCFPTFDLAERFRNWVRASVARTSPDAVVCVLSHEVRS